MKINKRLSQFYAKDMSDKDRVADENNESDQRLLELGYRSEFRREMSLFGVLGMSFCAIGILTGMSSAFQTGLFSGGPLGMRAFNYCGQFLTGSRPFLGLERGLTSIIIASTESVAR